VNLQIGRIDRLELLSPDWGPLAEASGNVFGTPEWLTTWWRHFGADQELRLYTVRDEGRLVALLPLVVWRRRSPRVLRFAGHGPSDVMGPICAPADRPAAAAALKQVLSADDDWDVLLAERLPSPDLLPDSLRERELQRDASPLLEIGGTSWDDYLAAYEDVLNRCSTDQAPWYVIPANRNWFRNLAIADILASTLEELDPRYPKPTEDLSQVVID